MTTAVKRKRGAQPGNRNACKPGLYHAPPPNEQQISRKISYSHGFEFEINALRQSIKSILSEDAPDYRLIKQGYYTLVSLTRHQLRLDRDDSRRLGQTAKGILRDMSALVKFLFSKKKVQL